VIALVPVLIALAGLFAERAVSAKRRDVNEARLKISPPGTMGRSVPHGLVWAVAVVILAVVTDPSLALGAAAVAVAVGRVVARRRRTAAWRRRQDQLPDAVAATSAALKAGFSLAQGLSYARDEAQPPLREDLVRLVDRIQVGTPVGEALSMWAEDLDSEDARLIAGVLDLHRRSGGDLPSVLDGLVDTLRERRAAQREVRALTAQARLSGMILGTLPVGFFGFLILTSRREMLRAIGTPLGRTAIAVGLGLEMLAFLWIRRLLVVR
jgi:tight adherence protein B